MDEMPSFQKHIELLEDASRRFNDKTNAESRGLNFLFFVQSPLSPQPSLCEKYKKLLSATLSEMKKNPHDIQGCCELLNHLVVESGKYMPENPWIASKILGDYPMILGKSIHQALGKNSQLKDLKSTYPSLTMEKGIESEEDGGHTPGFYYVMLALDVHNVLKNYNMAHLENFFQQDFINQVYSDGADWKEFQNSDKGPLSPTCRDHVNQLIEGNKGIAQSLEENAPASSSAAVSSSAAYGFNRT